MSATLRKTLHITLSQRIIGKHRDHEVPSTGSPATGRGFVLYDSATRKVTGNLSLSDITATKAHIHQGAEGENGDVIVPLSNPSLDGRNWTVSAPTPTLTLDQAGALLTDGM